MKLQALLIILGVSILYPGALVIDAYAYLDPGTGSVIVQFIIAGLVGAGITLKVYWAKVKYKLSTSRK